MDDAAIKTVEQLDAALESQRVARLARLRRKAKRLGWWPNVLVAIGIVLQIVSYVCDRSAISLARCAICCFFLLALAADFARRRREAERLLKCERQQGDIVPRHREASISCEQPCVS
jgi:hypothetical protein